MKDMFLAEELGFDPYQPSLPDDLSSQISPPQAFEAVKNADAVDEVLGAIYDWHQDCEHGQDGNCEIHDAIKAGKSEREIIEIAYYVDADLFDRFDFIKALSDGEKEKYTKETLVVHGDTIRFAFERDDEDEGLFLCGYSQTLKDINGGALNIAHLHVPDDAFNFLEQKYSIGDLHVDARYQKCGVATFMADRMSKRLNASPSGAQSYFSAAGKEWWVKYSEHLIKKEAHMNEKLSFITNQKPEQEFTFGSNKHGYVNADGTVWFDSHGLELSDFKSIKDFADWYYDENPDVEFIYRYRIGQRDGEGMITCLSPEMKYDPIDQKEDGSDVWSSPVLMRGKEILCCGVKNPTPDQKVMATNMSLESKREILRECNEDPHGGLNPIGMMDRIKSVHSLNVSSMGDGDGIIGFLSETYNFSPKTIKDVLLNHKEILFRSEAKETGVKREFNKGDVLDFKGEAVKVDCVHSDRGIIVVTSQESGRQYNLSICDLAQSLFSHQSSEEAATSAFRP